MILLKFVLLFLVFDHETVATFPDCNLTWPSCTRGDIEHENIVCKRYTCEISRKCWYMIPSDEGFRSWVLQKHNTLRNKLALGEYTLGGNTKASNMMVFSYDLDLEKTIACFLNQCEDGYPSCVSTQRYNDTTQNVFKGGESSKNRRLLALKQWHEPYKHTTAAVIDSYVDSAAYRSFTAMVWAQTMHLGCWRSFDYQDNMYIACNYGPKGNIPGQPVYKRGEPCSNCPDQLTCNKYYGGLCGEINNPDMESCAIMNQLRMTCHLMWICAYGSLMFIFNYNYS